MDETNRDDLNKVPSRRPEGIDWRKVAIRVAVVLLIVVGVLLLIKLVRRGGAGVIMAAAAPIAAASIRRRSPKQGQDKQPDIDQEFLVTRLRNIAEAEPVLTPFEMHHVLNTLFEKGGLLKPFGSPQQMARELKKLGLQSSVRSVPGRSERRWYDLTGYGTHEAPAY